MENRANYAIVGAFVVILALSGAFFIFWLGKYGIEEKKYDFYDTYFKESVAGLNIESAVKYRGLNVGVVKKIEIDDKNSELIKVTLQINENTPIKEDSFTVLETQGLTGLAFVEIKGGSEKSKILKQKEDKIYTIESQSSLISTLGKSAGSITQKLDISVDKINNLLSDKNIENISQIIQNLNNFSSNLEKTNDKINDILNKAIEIENSAISVSKEASNGIIELKKEFKKEINNFDYLFENINITISNGNKLIFDTNNLISKIDNTIERGDYNIDNSLKNITNDSIKNLNKTIGESKNMILELENLIKNLNESPSDILFKEKNIILGPGEVE